MANGARTTTAQVKNGTVILPKVMRNAWQRGKVFVFSTSDMLVIHKPRKRIKTSSVSNAVIDQRLAKSLADFAGGRSWGPFHSAKALMASLERNRAMPHH